MGIKIYRSLILNLGIVGYMMFLVYSNSLKVMYPHGNNSYTNLFNGLLILALLVGPFIPLKSLRGSLATIGFGVLVLFSIITITSGVIFAYNIKTEEFIFYFLFTVLTTLIFTSAVTAIGRFLLYRSELDGREILQVMSIGLFGILTGYFIDILTGSIASIYVWIGITAILLLSYYLVRKEKLTTTV